jgi:hypothetical protein
MRNYECGQCDACCTETQQRRPQFRTTTTITNNQYYGGLNRRFDRRAELLQRLGWKYVICNCDEFPERSSRTASLAVFRRTRRGMCRIIPAATVIHADRRSWIDLLRSALR